VNTEIEPHFQPFTDRLSRDIRNDLSRSLPEAIRSNSLAPAKEVGNSFLQHNLHPCYQDYISERLSRYSRALVKIRSGHNDPLYHGLVLWDESLFFEVHEILEHAWMKAVADDRLFLQAMIRSAGVYIKMEAGYRPQAKKIAAKAIPVLSKYRSYLQIYTNPEILIAALGDVDRAPPTLLS